MPVRFQRGELSLTWCIILFVLVTSVGFAGVLSVGYERNLFAEAWAYVKGAAPSVKSPLPEKASSKGKGDASQITKCKVDGRVVYSNTGCPPSADK